MRAIIVEDNIKMLEGLESTLREPQFDIEVVDTATSVVAGAKSFRENKPDLIFLDIQLPDGSGFDLLEIINENVKVIFTTASDDYAIRAFRIAAVDYLLKPYSKSQLLEAVERARWIASPGKNQLGILNEAMSGFPERIALHAEDKVVLVNIGDIVRCEADNNYTEFHLLDGSTRLVSTTLKVYDELLTKGPFFRVHRSHLVNKMHINEFVKTDGGYLKMTDGKKVPVSTRKRQAVLDWLG